MTNEQIRRNIRRCRRAAGLTQDSAAQALGIKTSTYAGIENGPTGIIYKRLDEMARIFDVSPEELILGYEPIQCLGELHSERDFNEWKAEVVADFERQKEEFRKEIQELKETIRSLMNNNDFLLKQLQK